MAGSEEETVSAMIEQAEALNSERVVLFGRSGIGQRRRNAERSGGCGGGGSGDRGHCRSGNPLNGAPLEGIKWCGGRFQR